MKLIRQKRSPRPLLYCGTPIIGIILVMLGVRFAFGISLGRETDELEKKIDGVKRYADDIISRFS